MTATLHNPVASPAAAPLESGTRLRRHAAGLSFIGAATLMFAGILATPWEGKSGESAYLHSLAAHPKQAVIAATLLHFGYLLFVPASFVMARLARRSARKLSAVGITLAVLGSGLSGLLVTDIYDLSIARHVGTTAGVPISNMKDVPLAGLGFISMGLVASVGAILGLVLLAVAMWRGRMSPLWPAIAMLAGFALSLGAHNMTRATVAFGAAAVALAFLGIKVLRLGDERFAAGADPR